MATIIFYEKPSCRNNTRQKALLAEAGHVVEARNLLEQEWTTEELEKFFGSKPIADCFNTSAPAITSGQLQPESLSRNEALALMVKEPILIKRPLMTIGEHYLQGFSMDRLHELIGLTAESEKTDFSQCPHDATSVCR
uniref:Nitrogenase-associated protein n=1 Tax=Chlorobium chlorochromatii (strain CaD3) TaxID=340177 RepID=Q3AQB5_CHLCH